ncbi:hypothetical protein BTO01_20445 [Vibrio jasicida]|uniref:hypothetical protein n=1 Tax=Vibrio jasicida TaxID=766224 RepID=UPI000CF3836C|nr:hypothetical protein [Vibrio jasicida]PQJ59210.1 hypothetical protein BTO01_20445 [Vibrio jasicida]
MGKVALDDALFVEYFRFKNGKSSDHSLVGNLLSNLKMPFVQSPCQAFRCHQGLTQQDKDGFEVISAPLLRAFLSSGYPSITIEELAKKSQYHLVLTADATKTKYPYLNINNKNIELNYSKTCLKGESRDEMVEHLTSLCADAIKVTICDNYFFATPWSSSLPTTEKLFDHILPKKSLTIQFVSNSKSVKAHETLIKTKHSGWSVSKYNGTCYSPQNHDRYLIIDKPEKSVEVMLSSGFIYLWKTEKEITCVFREK